MKLFLLLLVTCGATALLSAHECWLQPSTFSPAPGEKVRLSIQVGMDFKGEVRPFNPARVAALRHFSASGIEDWTGNVSATLDFPASFATAGTHVVAYDSKPSLIELDAEKFHEYLREEGLDRIIGERAQAGESAKPGRERYQRYCKTIIEVGRQREATPIQQTGQRLEIILLDDPATITTKDRVRFKIVFDGRPLDGAKVRAWHRTSSTTVSQEDYTSPSGEVALALFARGEWMISTVHMVRTTGDAAADWESHWGNLTLALKSSK